MDAQGYIVPAMENARIMVEEATAANKAPRESIFGLACCALPDKQNTTISMDRSNSGAPHQKI